MYPYHYGYDTPVSAPRYGYGVPSYSRPDSQYLQALAEEEAARRQYQQALREQENARNRAARARLARQAYESPAHDSYLADEDDYGYRYAPPAARSSYPTFSDMPYLSPHEQRALLQERQRLEQQAREQQMRIEALERERERERQRIRALEEERKRRLLEEERRRRIMLEEEERQRLREEERRRREEEEYLRRHPSQTSAFSPLEELLGFRPSRFMQPETTNSRRARTMSPAHRGRSSEPTSTQSQPPRKAPAPERESSRSPPKVARIPITSPRPAAAQTPKPTQPAAQQPQPPRSPSPRRYSPEEAAAAEKIQTFWRTHHQRRQALASIAELAAKFEQLKAAFTLPEALDYTLDDQHLLVPTAGWVEPAPGRELAKTPADAKLSYVPTNAPVHAYEEELNRILTKLDGVQSGGDETVRNRRRELARKVEREAERIEKVKVLVWRAWVEKQKEAKLAEEAPREEKEADPMSVESAPAPEESQPSQPAPSDASAEVQSQPPEEMQVDGQDSTPSEQPHPPSSSHDDSPDPTPATDGMDVTPDTHHPEAPSDIAPAPVEDVEVPDAEKPSDEMQLETDHSPSTVDQPMESDAPAPTEPSDVDIADADPPADHPPADEMQVEDDTATDVQVDELPPTDDHPSEPQPSVPIIVEEPDPDAPEQRDEPADVDADAPEDVVALAPSAAPPQEEVVHHPPLTASVGSAPASPLSPSPLSPPPASSPPGLVYTVSEAGDADTPPHTPPLAHAELAGSGAQTKTPGTPRAPAPQDGQAEKLQMLRPLVSEDWDEEVDFF